MLGNLLCTREHVLPNGRMVVVREFAAFPPGVCIIVSPVPTPDSDEPDSEAGIILFESGECPHFEAIRRFQTWADTQKPAPTTESVAGHDLGGECG